MCNMRTRSTNDYYKRSISFLVFFPDNIVYANNLFQCSILCATIIKVTSQGEIDETKSS